MRKILDKTTVVAAVGFVAGYYLGRKYDVTVAFKKVGS